MKFPTQISCSRQASTIFSSKPFVLASRALCSTWFAGANLSLKKSISVGAAGISGSRGSSCWYQGRMSPATGSGVGSILQNQGVAMRLSNSMLIASSSASALSERVAPPAIEATVAALRLLIKERLSISQSSIL